MLKSLQIKLKRMDAEKLPIVHEKSCGVLTFQDVHGSRRYLLLHYPGGHWDYPKGHVEGTDMDEEGTARRELKEETGIEEVNFISGFREAISYSFVRANKEIVQKEVVYFIGKVASHEEAPEVSLSFEHKNFEWLNYEQALARVTYENARQLLVKVEDFLRKIS